MKKYIIQLMDKKELELDEGEGIILKQALAKGNVPTYIEIGDTLIASHQIIGVFPHFQEEKLKRLPEAPMTEEQKQKRAKLLSEMRNKLSFKNYEKQTTRIDP